MEAESIIESISCRFRMGFNSEGFECSLFLAYNPVVLYGLFIDFGEWEEIDGNKVSFIRIHLHRQSIRMVIGYLVLGPLTHLPLKFRTFLKLDPPWAQLLN